MRSNKKIIALAGITIIFGSTVLSGCGESSGENVIITETPVETTEQVINASAATEQTITATAATTAETEPEYNTDYWKQNIIENDGNVSSEDDILEILNSDDAEECAYIYSKEEANHIYCLSKINKNGEAEEIAEGVRGYDKIQLSDDIPALTVVDSSDFGSPAVVVVIKDGNVYNVPVADQRSYPVPILMGDKCDDGTYSWEYSDYYSAESYQPMRNNAQCEFDPEAYCFVPADLSELDTNYFRLYEAEVKSGYPEICDIESIKARQKNDVENFYNTEFALGGIEVNHSLYHRDNKPDHMTPLYDKSTYKYIEEDMDCDGEYEYYLIIENVLRFSNIEGYVGVVPNSLSDSSISLTIYYIENTGETSFVFFMNDVSVRTVPFNYEPVYYMVDYGNCKHMINVFSPMLAEYGGSRPATLFNKDSFFMLPTGSPMVEFSNEQQMLISDNYTLIDELKWDGSDYTVYHYKDEEIKEENGDWIKLGDYHDNLYINSLVNSAVEVMKWYYGE